MFLVWVCFLVSDFLTNQSVLKYLIFLLIDAGGLVKIIALVGFRCRKHSKAAKAFTKAQLAKVGADIKLLVRQV